MAAALKGSQRAVTSHLVAKAVVVARDVPAAAAASSFASVSSSALPAEQSLTRTPTNVPHGTTVGDAPAVAAALTIVSVMSSGTISLQMPTGASWIPTLATCCFSYTSASATAHEQGTARDVQVDDTRNRSCHARNAQECIASDLRKPL